MSTELKIRPLEREDLHFIHKLQNDPEIMAYWFDEPYHTIEKLQFLYDQQIHSSNERRFVVTHEDELVGIVELMYMNPIHRNVEFQIIIDPAFQGRGFAVPATRLALDYAFRVLNMHKVYLFVDTTNKAAIHIYKKIGFVMESTLKESFFVEGNYHDAFIMSMFQRDYLNSSI